MPKIKLRKENQIMIYGYGRVSTKGQAKDGNSLEAQERLLKEHGAEVIYMDWNRWRTWWRNRDGK